MTLNTIKPILEGLFSVLPGNQKLRRFRDQFRERRRYAQLGNREEVFRHHYETNEWGNDESVSGPGSTLQHTENIRMMFPQLVNEMTISTILDAPCGDFNWFRTIQWEMEITYIGADIVEPLVTRNNSTYANSATSFHHLDITQDILPQTDLWLCRDCLAHLSTHDVFLVIDNFLRSDIRYLLASTHPRNSRNRNIPTGSFQLLNLQRPPFNFGEPIRTIDDQGEGLLIRQLALWDRGALKREMASNQEFQHAISRH